MPALVDKSVPPAERGCKSGLDTTTALSSATDDSAESNTSPVIDAETDGRIIVKRWDAIGEQGVFVGAKPIAAGEILDTLKGVIVRRRRLTRSERRRLIGIRVDGRAAHIDVEGRWPGKINHAPPRRSNADWDADTQLITVTRDMQVGEQVFFDYQVGYWVDDLLGRDYVRLPKDQRAFFDVMHAAVDNYAWLSHAIHARKLSQTMRIGLIALYLSQQCIGIHSVDKWPTSHDASSRAMTSVHPTNPLVRYLLDFGADVHQDRAVNLRSSESVSETNEEESAYSVSTQSL